MAHWNQKYYAHEVKTQHAVITARYTIAWSHVSNCHYRHQIVAVSIDGKSNSCCIIICIEHWYELLNACQKPWGCRIKRTQKLSKFFLYSSYLGACNDYGLVSRSHFDQYVHYDDKACNPFSNFANFRFAVSATARQVYIRLFNDKQHEYVTYVWFPYTVSTICAWRSYMQQLNSR